MADTRLWNATKGWLEALCDTTGRLLLGASEEHLGEVGGKVVSVSTLITGHAGTGAYLAGDVVGSVLALADVARVNGGSGYITEVRLATNKKSITPRFRIHLFNASNPTVAADDAAHKELYADVSKRLGYIDMPAMTTAADSTNSDMSRSVLQLSPAKPFKCASATTGIWVLLEALDGFTPSDTETYTLTAYVEQY